MANRPLVILAGTWDERARALAERWSGAGAVLLSPPDLSLQGWRLQPRNPGAFRAVIGARWLRASEIGSVLVRLPYVSADELPHIAPSDRAYVAEEMTAFLLAWLTELPCLVVNRPTPSCLAGPALRDEQWVRLASSRGIPCRPVLRRVRLDESREAPRTSVRTTVTVVGKRQLGEAHPSLTKHAACLATAAGVDVLAVHFDGADGDGRLVGADLWPDVDHNDVADNLLELLSDDSRPASARDLRAGQA